MSEIAPYIKEVLCRHNAVVIPNFGAFEWHYSPARLERLDQKIFPPTYSLVFNPEKHQDERQILANLIASKKGISIDAAKEQLIGYRLALEQQLFADKVINFPQLGLLKIAADNRPVLEMPTENDWAITPATGLALLDANPILRDKSYLHQATNKGQVAARKLPILWIATGALSLVGISSIWWLPALIGSGKTTTEQISELSIMPIVTESQEHVLELISAHENKTFSAPIAKADIIEIESPPSNTTIEVPSDENMSTQVPEQKTEPKEEPKVAPKEEPKTTPNYNTETVLGNNDYIIVIGVFGDASNIARNEALLRDKGYQVQSKQLATGYTRIAAVVNCSTKQELNERWAQIRSEFTPKAWIARQ